MTVMGRILYFSGLFFYHLAIRISSLFNAKARALLKGRKGWKRRLQQDINEGDRVIWFHCASLGEFEQGRPVIEAVRKDFPRHKILLTFYSPSGYDVRKDYDQADLVYYLPLDSARNAKAFLKIVNPMLVIFVKYEFWYHYLKQIHRNKVPFMLISAIFREDQVFFKSYGGFYRSFLKFFTHLFVQDHKSVTLLEMLDLNPVQSGDTRFDRVAKIATSARQLPEIEEFIGDHLTIVAGSTWEEDHKVLVPFINSAPEGVQFIIAPHEVNAPSLRSLEKGLEVGSVRYSGLGDKKDGQVLIIDNIGMLSSLYRYADIAYVGGAFGKGLHNILEPATFGIPVIFGNQNYEKFREANELIARSGAFAIGSAKEFEDRINLFTEDEEARKASGESCSEYVQNNTGATSMILREIQRVLP